ncbi:hypothetical protein SUDANB51_06623 [Streptomyces sp. enrichment culture]
MAQAAPHSMVLAMCQVRPGSAPSMRGSAANSAVSLARPARTTSQPAPSASWMGSTPIMATV